MSDTGIPSCKQLKKGKRKKERRKKEEGDGNKGIERKGRRREGGGRKIKKDIPRSQGMQHL